jgi:hypothetical protein
VDENGTDPTEIDLTEDTTLEIDLRDRLLFAAGSLAADYGDSLPVDLAEALVLSSAQGLLVSASVTEFVPILAERRARQSLRSSATVPSPPQAAVPVPRTVVPTPRPAVPAPRPAVPAPRPEVPSSRPGVPTPNGPAPAPRTSAAPSAHAVEPAAPSPVPAASAPTPAPSATEVPGVAPLVAVPEDQMARLRGDMERARRRVAAWRAEQGRRGGSAT